MKNILNLEEVKHFNNFCRIVINKHDTDAFIDFVIFSSKRRIVKKDFKNFEFGVVRDFIELERKKLFVNDIQTYWNDYMCFVFGDNYKENLTDNDNKLLECLKKLDGYDLEGYLWNIIEFQQDEHEIKKNYEKEKISK